MLKAIQTTLFISFLLSFISTVQAVSYLPSSIYTGNFCNQAVKTLSEIKLPQKKVPVPEPLAEDEVKWMDYEYHQDDIHFKVQFPTDPIVNDKVVNPPEDNSLISFISVENDVIYLLEIPKPALPGLNREDAIDLVLMNPTIINPAGTVLVNKQVLKKGDTFYIDLINYIDDLKIISKRRLVVAPNNMYMLSSFSALGDEANHQLFIESFEILP